MPRVSRIPVKKYVYKDLLDSFVNLIIDFREETEVKAFLNDFLTPEEKLMLSKRLILALMIKKNFSVEDIRGILRVSKATVHSMKHWLSYKKGIEIGVEKLRKREKSKRKGGGNRFLKMLELGLSTKRDMRARAKLLSGDY